jgi:hypothetical protein
MKDNILVLFTIIVIPALVSTGSIINTSSMLTGASQPLFSPAAEMLKISLCVPASSVTVVAGQGSSLWHLRAN